MASGADLGKTDVLISTPQRLASLQQEGKLDLSRVCYLVLDEADQLFEGGFLEQIDAVMAAVGTEHTKRAEEASAAAATIKARRGWPVLEPTGPTIRSPRPCLGPPQGKKGSKVGGKKGGAAVAAEEVPPVPVVKCLFSATLPDKVEEVAKTVLRQPLRITVGARNTAVSTVKQQLLFVGREAGKLMSLRQLLREGSLRPPVLVFVESKERAKTLHRELMYDGIHVDSLHADQPQVARNAAVESFRTGKTWVLIATDLIGRGMDFLGVNTVVNFDFPSSTTDYIHRIGRTGRAGREGSAVTFYTEDDKPRLRPIANVIKEAGGEVGSPLLPPGFSSVGFEPRAFAPVLRADPRLDAHDQEGGPIRAQAQAGQRRGQGVRQEAPHARRRYQLDPVRRPQGTRGRQAQVPRGPLQQPGGSGGRVEI